MGMYDEIRCDVPMPDGFDASGVIFQTKSFPDIYGARYTISCDGRVLDSHNADMEVDGYISFYSNDGSWREYQALFRDGNLEEIVVVREDLPSGWHFGIARCRISQAPSTIFDTTTATEAYSQDDVLRRANSVFAGKTSAQTWMEAPIQALDGHRPIDLCTSAEGRKHVVAILKKIESGDFS